MVKDHSDREETRCRHMGYSFQLAARVLLYTSSHKQDDTYHDVCYTSRGALAGTGGSSDQILIVDPLSYFLFQPLLNNWGNKGHDMYYPLWVPLLIIGKSSL